ncbi:MAG: hypothetical protein M1816_005957 [Peltula sp. TS41687]|nr:MAG: hypothetical protein M1816_005957 [Peltula sp. TS41687]
MRDTTRQSKRPFQPSITSYFPPNEGRPSTLSRQSPSSRHASPVLPTAVQSSLLNVGMRVRKSVPEGYKTKEERYSLTPNVRTTINHPTSTAGLRSRELAPFCGILKVGGYNRQQMAGNPPDIDDIPPLDYDLMDGENLPASSQDSIATIASTGVASMSFRPSNSNKRRLHDEEEEEQNYSTDLVIFEDEEVSLSTRGWGVQGNNAGMLNPIVSRPLAQPRSRRKGFASLLSKRHAVHDQENTASSATSGCAPDFEEAAFLQPLEVVCDEVGMDEL